MRNELAGTTLLLILSGTAVAGVGVPVDVHLIRGESIDLPGQNAHCESDAPPGTQDPAIVELRTSGNKVRLVGIAAGTARCFGVTVPGWHGDNRVVDVFVFEAPSLLKTACAGADAAACQRLGDLYLAGAYTGTRLKQRIILQENIPRAVALFKQACDGGAVRGCLRLAAAHLGGSGFYDPVRAAAIYEQLCTKGEIPACDALGNIYAPFYPHDVHRKMPPDAGRAWELFHRACDAGYLQSCNNLGVMYARGLGTNQDEVRAEALYKQACDGHASFGCHNLAAGGRADGLADTSLPR